MWIPETDILGQQLQPGDRVVVFNEHFISWENSELIYTLKPYTGMHHTDFDEPELRAAIQVDEGMWFFGLGTHEILKI